MIPPAVECGFGELGKHGSIINKEYGSSFRLAAVLTDIPLIPTPAETYDVDDFCGRCQVCANACPPEAMMRTGSDFRICRIRSKKWHHFSTKVPPVLRLNRFQSPTFSRNGNRCSRIVSIRMPPVALAASDRKAATGGMNRYSMATQTGAA